MVLRCAEIIEDPYSPDKQDNHKYTKDLSNIAVRPETKAIQLPSASALGLYD